MRPRLVLAVLLLATPAQARDRLDSLEQQLHEAQTQLAELKAQSKTDRENRSTALAQIRRDSDSHCRGWHNSRFDFDECRVWLY